MRKVFHFGKIDYNGCGRKINEVTINIELKKREVGKPVFTASVDIWNSKHTDVIACGQMIDDVVNEFFPKNKIAQEIKDLWEKYHLNDLHAGTPTQMKFIEEHKDEIVESDGWYTKELNLLKKYGMERDIYNGVEYYYGKSWVYWPISDEDLERINKLFDSELSTNQN